MSVWITACAYVSLLIQGGAAIMTYYCSTSFHPRGNVTLEVRQNVRHTVWVCVPVCNVQTSSSEHLCTHSSHPG